VHWPAGTEAKGEIRHQFSHVIDIAATVLDAAGLPHPTFVHGVQQMPLHGKSMVPSFADAEAPEHRETQYFEMFVNRGVYHQGWTAATRHSTPWVVGAELPALDDDVWELYEPGDWTQSNDVSAENPEKLHELQRLFLIEAVRYGVLPLDDRRVERFEPHIAGRPMLVKGNSQILYGGMKRISENSMIGVKNRSHSVTAQLVVPEGGAEGVVIAQGGTFGGWSLYLKEGRPTYCYNLLGIAQFKVAAEEPLAAGERQLRMEFGYDGGGLGKGGDVALCVDGTKVGEGRVEGTMPLIFSGDETTDLGTDTGTPVSDDYVSADCAFTGKIEWVQVDVDEAAEDPDHLITPEERLRVALARQ
jgi:arylsulfatase